MNRQLLMNLLNEYGHSLTRIDGERDQMKAIAARAVAELGLEEKDFKRVAVALHKDALAAERDTLSYQLGLFELVIDASPEEKAAAAVAGPARALRDSLKAHGATLTIQPVTLE